MRYRGPYEYDKFTLNIFNYINYVNDYIYDMNNTSDEYNTFKQMQDDIDAAFNRCMNNSETVYKTFIMNKDGENN
jgi:hypothetical protein